jgi:ATP-binding cassette subfamily B multidrug efflux pump
MIASFLTDDSFVEASALRPMPRIEPARDQVVTEHLRFEYEPGEPVLDDISLAFRRGTSTALVGASGSGKTTLVELLAGYRPVQGGRLLIDHQDIAEFDAGSYRDQVGYVTQDTIMFHDTLRKNLTFLRPEATDDEVARALSLAAADEFVDRRGLEAILGEQGMKLSGGQRQRIALARVVLQDPGLLLLDEATSALDLYTEQRVFQNLLALREDKILVVVAHRLSAIARFDNIVVLHRGKVA